MDEKSRYDTERFLEAFYFSSSISTSSMPSFLES